MSPQHNGLSSGRYIQIRWLNPLNSNVVTTFHVPHDWSIHWFSVVESDLLPRHPPPPPPPECERRKWRHCQRSKKKEKFIESPVVHLAFIHVHVRWIYFILLFHYFSSPVSDPVPSIPPPQIASVRCTKTKTKKPVKTSPRTRGFQKLPFMLFTWL